MKVNRTIELDDNVFQVGDVISFTLSGDEPVQAMAMKQEQDGMIFLLVDCLQDEYRMNAEDTNLGGYDASELKVRMDGEILDRFPAELRDRMVPFESGSLLRLPTEKEIFGENLRGAEEDPDVTQWGAMKLRRNRIAFQGPNGPMAWYWLANPSNYSAASFVHVSSDGDAYWNAASASDGVRPAFKIRNFSLDDPLTLEELREMNGGPVWIRNLCSGDYARSVIAQSDEHFTLLADGCLRENRSYGSHWLSYRRKPEEGTT